MSDSVRPHRQQPMRLPCPWDSPGKNTAVGCHFLLQCMKVKSESEVAQSCSTLATPRTAAYQAPPSMGFSRQKYWSGVPLPSPMHESEKVKVKSLSCVQLLVTPWTAAYQAPPSMGLSRQEYYWAIKKYFVELYLCFIIFLFCLFFFLVGVLCFSLQQIGNKPNN